MKKRKVKNLLTKIKTSKMRMFNFWSWPIDLYEDLQTIAAIKSALKEESVQLQLKSCKYELRWNKFGTIYTVINIPSELLEVDKQKMIWAWVLDQLREIDVVLMHCQLSDLVEPVITKIDDKSASAYLIKLKPLISAFNIGSFLGWIYQLGTIFITGLIANMITVRYANLSLFDFIASLF